MLGCSLRLLWHRAEIGCREKRLALARATRTRHADVDWCSLQTWVQAMWQEVQWGLRMGLRMARK